MGWVASHRASIRIQGVQSFGPHALQQPAGALWRGTDGPADGNGRRTSAPFDADVGRRRRDRLAVGGRGGDCGRGQRQCNELCAGFDGAAHRPGHSVRRRAAPAPPLVHEVGVQPVRLRHSSHRCARLGARRQHPHLLLICVRAPCASWFRTCWARTSVERRSPWGTAPLRLPEVRARIKVAAPLAAPMSPKARMLQTLAPARPAGCPP